MADENLFDQGLEKTSAPATNATPTGGNLFDQGLSGGGSASASVPPPVQTASAAPVPTSGNLFDAGLQSPVNGQSVTTSEGHLYQDSSQPWYKRAFDWANTPLTESIGGLNDSREGAGGFERATEKIASGFTSPLSLALTAATFGTGGLIESAGANLLKQTGLFTAEQLPTIVKASEAALEASKALKPLEPVINSALEKEGGAGLVSLVNKAKDALGPVDLSSRLGEENIQSILAKKGFSEGQLNELSKASKTIQEAKGGFTPVEDAVKSAVGDDGYNLWKQGQDVLHENGLTEHDLVGGNALERGAFQIIKKTVPTMSVASAAQMAKTANALLTAGFTYQQFETAAAMSPRFLDALKEGDWEAAKEYGTEAAAGAAFGLLGTPHALHAAGELFKPILGTPDEPVKFRPNDQFIAVQRAAKDIDANSAVGNAYAKEIDSNARKALGHPENGKTDDQQKLELASVYHHVVTGGDADKAGAWYNALSEAAGRDEKIPVNGQSAMPQGTFKTAQGSVYQINEDGSTSRNKAFRKEHGEQEQGPQPRSEETFYITPQDAQKLGEIQTNGPKRTISVQNGNAGVRYQEGSDSGKIERRTFVPIQNQPAKGLIPVETWNSGSKFHFGNEITEIGNAGRPVNGLPDDIASKIQNSAFAKQPKDYQDLILNSLKKVATGDLSDKELAASKQLRDEDARNYEIGSANDLLHSWIPDHIHRVYEDENPDGRIVNSNAKQGKFSTNVSQARHQVYDSHLIALLKSPKKIVMDPIQSVAQDRVDLVKAAANRQFVDTLRDNFTRGSDGRPAVVLSGAGRVIQGPDGTDPKTFISPNRIRKLNIADGVVDNLRQTGDLQRFLDDGTIKEVTPKLRNENIDDFISRLEDKGVSQEPKYDEEGNNLLRQNIAELQRIKTLQGSEKAEAMNAYNAKQKSVYAWDPQDFVSLEHPSMKGWKFATSDPSGNPIFVNSDIMVHPEFASFIQNRLGLAPSDLQNNPVGKALLGAGAKLKETLLIGPFHQVQIALRGLMTGVNPFTLEAPDLIHGAKVDPSDPNSPTKLFKMVQQGYTPGVDYRGLQAHSEGVSSGGGLVKNVPLVGKTIAKSLNWYQDFLFKRYIPAIKATAAEHMFDEYRNLHPDWSVDRAAKAAGMHANDSFGGVNYKAMGRSATTQDWGRILLLANDWLESELRSGARLFNGEEGGLGRAQVAKMSMALWGIARVLNYATTGNFHNEAPFGVAIKNKEGKETIFGIRTLPTDLLHLASSPVDFLKGRLSPTIRAGQEILTQRDQLGRKLSPEDMWIDVFRNMAPIPIQSVGQAITNTGPAVGNIGQGWKAIGGTAQTYSTPAQQLAAELAANHNEDGPVDPAVMARHRTVMELEDRLRTGDVTWPELYQLAYQQDQITPKELDTIKKNYKSTRELDPGTASLYVRASRLPAPEYLKLLDVADLSEKHALIPLTKQVFKRYVTQAKKNLTPNERAQDPTFQRIMRSLPQIETAEPAAQ